MIIECHDCGKAVDIRLLTECNECGFGHCDECITECSNCGTKRCYLESMFCSEDCCGELVDCCGNRGGVCAVCQKYLCDDHLYKLTKKQKQYYKNNKEVDWYDLLSSQKVFCKEHYIKLEIIKEDLK